MTNSTVRSDSDREGHTPLPWQALAPDEVDVFVPIIGVRLDENGEPMETPTNGLVGGATLYPTEIDAEDYERAKANAAFIVRAVNSHYDLLEAAREARAAVVYMLHYMKSPEGHPIVKQLDAAIAKARGAA